MVLRLSSFVVVGALFFIQLFFVCPARSDSFTHLTYAQIHFQIKNLSLQYPNLLRLYSAQDRFSLPHVGNCSELADSSDPDGVPAPCTIYVVEMTNFDTLSSDPTRPEWLVSGELHGDEVIGPPTVLAFIRYMVSNYDTNSFAHRMINTRLTTLVPMTNAVGFFRNEREELQSTGPGSQPLLIDPNRDFAFDQDPRNCMQTVAARALNELFRVHLFRVTVTFHGGTNALGYEWGDMTHCDGPNCKPAPDTRIMHSLAERMSNNAGPAGDYEDPYPFGDMGKLVYPVNGGLEDWAYGASWTDQAVVCRPETLGGYSPSRTVIERNTKRCVTYLVETSHAKRPESHTLGSSEDIEIRGSKGDGHIPRNVRLLFSVIDAIEPYIVLEDLSELSKASEPYTAWSVSGAFHVDATLVQWSTLNGTDFGLLEIYNGSAGVPIAGGDGKTFTQPLSTNALTTSTPLYYRIAAVVDQYFAKQPQGSVPDVFPQSHLMGSRASSKWKFTVDDRQVVGRRIFFSETVMVRLTESGGFIHAPADNAIWDETSVHGHLHAVSDDKLFSTMMPGKHDDEIQPLVSGASNRHVLLFSTLLGISGVVMVAVIIYLVIRKRRGRKERYAKPHLPFTLDDAHDEQIALSSEGTY